MIQLIHIPSCLLVSEERLLSGPVWHAEFLLGFRDTSSDLVVRIPSHGSVLPSTVHTAAYETQPVITFRFRQNKRACREVRLHVTDAATKKGRPLSSTRSKVWCVIQRLTQYDRFRLVFWRPAIPDCTRAACGGTCLG